MSVEVTALANGVTVATQAMPHLESVAMGLWIGAGARSETAREHGISHLLEHMAFKGTSKRNAREIAEAIEAVGGEVNAETSVDHTSYYVRLLKEDVALGLDVLADIVSNPLFEADDLEREQHVILQEIGAAEDSPEDLVFDMFQEAAFPGQAIGRSILGTPQSISAHSADDLRQFLRAQYCGTRTVLAATGNLDHDDVVRLAETQLSGLPDTAAPIPDRGFYHGGESKLVRPLQEAQVLLGFAGPSYTDPKFHAAHLLSAILGGGMASRLFQEIREDRGLCYSIYSFYSPFADTGLFGIHAATTEEDLEKLVPLILDELRKTADGVTPAELRRAKAQLRSGLLMGLESPISRAGQIGRQILIHGRPLGLQEMVDKVEAVTSADVANFAVGMLESFPTLAAIGPIGSLPDVGEFATDLSSRKIAVGW